MGSKPKVVQQESPEAIEEKAAALAQAELNAQNAQKRKNKASTALSSLDTTTALTAPKTNTGT